MGLGNIRAVAVGVGGSGDGEAVCVAVGVSGPVTGIPGWEVSVAAATAVWAMAVLMVFESGVAIPGGAQACETINNIEIDSKVRVVFGIFPPFRQRQ